MFPCSHPYLIVALHVRPPDSVVRSFCAISGDNHLPRHSLPPFLLVPSLLTNTPSRSVPSYVPTTTPRTNALWRFQPEYSIASTPFSKVQKVLTAHGRHLSSSIPLPFQKMLVACKRYVRSCKTFVNLNINKGYSGQLVDMCAKMSLSELRLELGVDFTSDSS